MASIKVTPEELSSQGEKLVGYAEDLKEVLSNVDSEVQTIIDGWDGLAQDAYYDMYKEMKTNLDKFPELVNALGDATKSAAEAFSTVDTELKGSFSSAMS